MQILKISKEPVELYKILKMKNLVQSGGEAKFVISQGFVLLNGIVEKRKSKKIYSGDIINFNDETIKIIAE
ncbi:MAG: RNA-binding protein [Deltaproteobacteria bacterium]|nr:MAG: RNA-binding protein [Deltaproteobacteria bacterium]PIE75034.1 MAG: RNA-binding protein [Deltaproteobacteria bacterium]